MGNNIIYENYVLVLVLAFLLASILVKPMRRKVRQQRATERSQFDAGMSSQLDLPLHHSSEAQDKN